MNYEPSQSIHPVWYVSATEMRKLPLEIYCQILYIQDKKW